MHELSSPTSQLPVIYSFGKKPIDVDDAAAQILSAVFSRSSLEQQNHVLILYDVGYLYAMESMIKILRRLYCDVISLKTGEKSPRLRFILGRTSQSLVASLPEGRATSPSNGKPGEAGVATTAFCDCSSPAFAGCCNSDSRDSSGCSGLKNTCVDNGAQVASFEYVESPPPPPGEVIAGQYIDELSGEEVERSLIVFIGGEVCGNDIILDTFSMIF